MPDSLPYTKGTDGAGCGGEFAKLPQAWPSTAPVLIAVEKRDQHGFRHAVTQLAGGFAPFAATAPAASALFLYDLLRTIAEALRPGRAPLPEGERLGMIALLGTQSTAAGLLAAFLGETERLGNGLSPGRATQHPVAQRARRFIDAHAGERLSLARVARELGVTRTYLSALFRRECGVTLTEYIHHVRIERAESLLRQGGLSMAAVAALSGYGSYRHFHRSFLKLRQVSPRAFLRTIEPAQRGATWKPAADAVAILPSTGPDRYAD